MTKALVIIPLAVLAVLALAACDPAPTPLPAATTSSVDAADETATPSPSATSAGLPDDYFLRLTARMTQISSGQVFTAVLTVHKPTPTSSSAAEISALAPCLVYTSNFAADSAGSPEPAWYGRADLTVTGDGEWDENFGVRIDTGGTANISTGDGAWFADDITCANVLRYPGTAEFVTYFPLNYAEGGIDGALNWSIFGFSDQGDAGGVKYDQCSVELSPHAESLSPAESGWVLHTANFGCYMGPTS